MRIITVSDLHIGKESWGNFGTEIAKTAAVIPEADVLYCGGDLAEPNKNDPQKGWDNFQRGLEILAKSSAPVKVFTLGNNDLEQLQNSRITEHYDEMKQRVQEYGFHLLDDQPLRVRDLAFVGNVGWYDGSLWWKFSNETKFPNDPEGIRKEAHRYFQEIEFPGKLPPDLTPELFYNHCRSRLQDHLDAVHKNEQIKAVVLGIHFVPSTAFLLGDDPEFAFLNWYMGAKGHAQHYQREKVILGFTGHTHRSDVHQIGKLNVHNLSGPEQPRQFEICKKEEVEEVIYTVRKIQKK